MSDDKEDDLLFFALRSLLSLSLFLSPFQGMRGGGEGWVSLLGNDEVRNTVLFVGELEMQFT